MGWGPQEAGVYALHILVLALSTVPLSSSLVITLSTPMVAQEQTKQNTNPGSTLLNYTHFRHVTFLCFIDLIYFSCFKILRVKLVTFPLFLVWDHT